MFDLNWLCAAHILLTLSIKKIERYIITFYSFILISKVN